MKTMEKNQIKKMMLKKKPKVFMIYTHLMFWKLKIRQDIGMIVFIANNKDVQNVVYNIVIK